MSGRRFDWVGVTPSNDVCRVAWEGGTGPVLKNNNVWFRGTYHGKEARLFFSTDGEHYTDTGLAVELNFGDWKGARLALFCYGPNGGMADVDFVKYGLRR